MRLLKKYSKLIRNAYTSLFATLMALLFSHLYYSSTVAFKKESEIIFEESHQLFFFNLLTLAVSLFAIIMMYYYFDNLDLYNKKDYLEGKNKKLLISKPEYLVGFAISLLFATSMLTDPIHNLLTTFGNLNKVWARLLSVASVAIIRLVQIYNLQTKWEDEINHPLFVEKPIFKNSQDIKRFRPHHLVLKPLGFLAIFTLCYLFVSAYLLEILFSVYIILTTLWQGTLLIALLPIIIIISIRILHNIKARRKLIKRLNRLVRDKSITVKYHGMKYISSIFPRMSFKIEVTTRTGEIYLCSIVCSGRVNAPMYFSDDKYYTEHGFHLRGGGLISQMGASPFAAVVDIGKWGGKTNPTNLIAGYRREHMLDFPEGNGTRALIINPAPTACFSLYENIANPIDTGENMGTYTIYSTTGFCNTVERGVNKDRFEH